MESAIRILFLFLWVFSGCCVGTKGVRCPDTGESAVSISFGIGRDGDSDSQMGEGIILSSMEWDYEPWETQFIRKLHSHWTVPYEYRTGTISGGTTVNILVAKNGVFRSFEFLEQEGHDYLHEASVRALNAISGQLPLPSEYPEEELLVTVNLKYPELD